MIVQRTAETEFVFARASNGRHDSSEIASLDGAICGVYAIWRWTPAQIILVVDVSPSEKLSIPGKHSVSHLDFCRETGPGVMSYLS